jgi:hypothetical protein
MLQVVNQPYSEDQSFSISVVKPLFKKGDKDSMTKYRPISLLCTF